MKRVSTYRPVLVLALILAAAAGAPASVWAQGHAAPAQASPASATAPMTEGEIKKIDKDAGKLTIKHGEMKHLGMMPMTMVFRVKDPAMLDAAPVGAQVSFSAERIEGALTVTAIAPAR